MIAKDTCVFVKAKERTLDLCSNRVPISYEILCVGTYKIVFFAISDVTHSLRINMYVT